MQRHCPVCQQAVRLLAHEVFGSFYRCTACGYTHKDAKDCLPETQCKALYDQHENHVDDPVYRGWFEAYIEEAIQPFLPQALKEDFKILDFGSGPEPVLASVLEEQLKRPVDIYDLHYAKDPSYLTQRYDLICSTEVIEHIEDPHFLFAHLRPRLKNGGLLSIMTLLAPKEDQAFLAWHYIRDRSHRSFFSLEAFEILAKTHGYNLIFSATNRRLHSFSGR